MGEIIKPEDFFGASNHKLAIRDIFAMYHHAWDVIGEGIQNAVDSVLKKSEEASGDYVPRINVVYNARVREFVFEDNGMGIPSNEVKAIVAPHVSLKNPLETNRGEFGVGLTFIAFYSNDFKLESMFGDMKASLTIKNGYSWAMSEDGKEELYILFDLDAASDEQPCTKVSVKPVRFPGYTLPQLEYVLQRYTAIGDFWSCYKKEDGSIKLNLTYVGEDGQKTDREIPNKFWHPADHLSRIGVETVDLTTVAKEVEKGKEIAMPNWIGFGLTDADTLIEGGKEFTYYALLCRPPYYRSLSEEVGLSISAEEADEDEEPTTPEPEMETLNAGIFVCKKGMPLGAVVNIPRTAHLFYWRGIFIAMNCDSLRSEPGRKKLHVEHEQIVRSVSRKVFYKLTKFAHYIIPRDPDEEFESLFRNVDKCIQSVRTHRDAHPLLNTRNGIVIDTDPVNEQTLIGLFHELIGAKIIHGYKALRLSAADTYDGIYEYNISKDKVGKEHWLEWLRNYPAKERKEIEERGIYHVDEMIVEFKMHLQDIIRDFLQKTKYHPHIKLIVAWDADDNLIKNKGWLLEKLPSSKQRFNAAYWRLRPSAEGQTRGILATDVLLLKDFLSESI
jgi:hypothetical protein